MRLVSGSRYDALNTRYQQVCDARTEAEELAEQRLKTITRQAAELTYFRDQNPDAPLPYPTPVVGDPELRRQLRLAREALTALDRRCCDLQDQNDKQARELRDLRQGAAS